MNDDVYLIEITQHVRSDITYYPFIIWQCYNELDKFINHIEMSYGKIKAIWKCDNFVDAIKWRTEILKMRGQEDLI